MRYVEAKRKEKRNRLIYEAYMTEAVKNISENVAKGLGQGYYMAKSYMDIIDPKPEPTETADDIINRIKGKLRNL